MMIKKLKDKLKQWFKKVTLKGVAKTFLVLLVLYLLLAYFAVNPIAKKLIPRIAEKSLASQASVGSVQFDPFRLKTTINDFQLANQNGVSLARFKKLVVDFELSGMFDLAWKFKKVGVAEPQLNFAITPDGAFNWEGLIAKLNESQSPPSDTIPSLVIEQIIVEQGKVQYADANRLEPINTVLTPLSFELEGLSTLPKDRGEYFISAAFAKQGGTLQWKGDMEC